MSKTPNYDAKIKMILNAAILGERTCRLTGEKWNFDEEHLGWCQKFSIPPSFISPKTRVKLLFGFSTGIAIWKRPHSFTNKHILSCVHPDSPYKVIADKEWYEFEPSIPENKLNLNQPFLPQMEELAYSVPVCALLDTGTNENTIGVDLVNAKDCYMGFGGVNMKDLCYFSIGTGCEQSVDITNNFYTRQSFYINHCERLFNCQVVFESQDCLNSSFLFDCRNCEYCFGATNKRNRKYLWWNEQLSKEEWEKRRADIDLRSYKIFENWLNYFHSFIEQKAIWPENFNVKSEDSTGDYLCNCLRCYYGFWQKDSRDCFWSPFNEKNEQCYFVIWSGQTSDSYSSMAFNSHDLRCCYYCLNCKNLEYSLLCKDCEYCFGCTGLRKKSFYIYNTPYTEVDYWQKVDELKCAMLDRKEYGEFFPARMALMGFPFSGGESFYHFSDKELEAFGAVFFDTRKGSIIEPEANILNIEDIPDYLQDINEDEFIGKAIYDSESQRLYSVTPEEFCFYKEHNLPFPRKHFLTRLKKLMSYCNSAFADEQTICQSCNLPLNVHPNQTFKNRQILCYPCYIKYLEVNG
ncbi:hypothetical protein CO172_02920 [Candidatus Uhrbacteria bacterium CG_4_9_14_3_um_filter_36_7]|uniref:Caib/baif family protein n=1 Tax=Candidatus Uhrbacteria bacterium CG_4_9_14_3_um_filter_36_7 TaxID=1975033 RepID=A0A2M7XH32_9BACT|nr:MAG: hypothetical protein CO172_02920 [Candidatus Uhrbacteria bacterium CG_4_9_14_3_um_filter_36_7]